MFTKRLVKISKFRTTRSIYDTIVADKEYTGNGRSLTSEEIRKLYPGVPVVRLKMTQEEKFARILKNGKHRNVKEKK